MSRYDGLIIPRSYSEYINKTDAATLQQALQLSGVLSNNVTSGDNKAVKSNAVAVALSNAIKALRYTFSYYVASYAGLYKISIPYTNSSNSIPVGSLLITARSGNAFLFNFYAFVNESTTPQAPNAGKVFQFAGNQYADGMLEPYLKWSVDTVNKKINYYLKKSDYANSRIVMTLLSYYQPEDYTDDITIKEMSDTTEWDNAQYSNNIEIVRTTGI